MNEKNEESENKKNLIGVDPLAWLSDEEKESVLNEKNSDASDESHSCLITLNSAITIRDMTELMNELNNIASEKKELIFDSENVEKIDAAALQLLSGFYLFSVKEGRKVIWQNPSEAFCGGADLLGLTEILQLPAVA